MPYKVYKKGSGYKACKKNGKKCFSEKPLSKEKAHSQMKALYASESMRTEQEQSMEDTLVFNRLVKYPKANQFHVHFAPESNKDVLVTIVYSAGDTMDDVDYVETHVTDGQKPNIEIFEDPQSEEAKSILAQHGLTENDIEMAGQEGYERISKHVPQSNVEEAKDDCNYAANGCDCNDCKECKKNQSIKESLEFEKLFGLIMDSES